MSKGHSGPKFTFFGSFLDYAKTIADKTSRLAFFEMITEYGINGIVPDSSDPLYPAFVLIRPNIDISAIRRAAGSKGGSSAGQSKARPGNKNASKTQAKPKQNASDMDKDMDKELEVCDIAHARKPRPSLSEILNVATSVMGVPEYYARWWYGEMEARGWTNTDGTSVGTRNWRPTLKAWHNREDAKHLAEIRETAASAEKREIKVSVKDWILCKERCANCGSNGCTKGVRTPPELQRRPPEECKSFTALKESAA